MPSPGSRRCCTPPPSASSHLPWQAIGHALEAGAELCQLAQVRHLCLFHHEPALDDGALAKMLEESRRYEEITRTGNAMRVSAAYDGLEITL